MKKWSICGVFTLLMIGYILMSGCTANVNSVQTEQTFTQSKIPNLTGTWEVKAHGEVIQKIGAPGPWTHFTTPNDTITAQAVITDQNERVLHGTFKAPLGKEENFIAMIGMDNKSWHYADYDGSSVGEIVNDSQINVIYTQISPNETIMASSTWIKVI